MTFDDFLTEFSSLFCEEDTSTFTKETKFRELAEWSSLIALSVMAMIDENFEETLTGDEMRSSQTIGDLYEIVENKKVK